MMEQALCEKTRQHEKTRKQQQQHQTTTNNDKKPKRKKGLLYTSDIMRAKPSKSIISTKDGRTSSKWISVLSFFSLSVGLSLLNIIKSSSSSSSIGILSLPNEPTNHNNHITTNNNTNLVIENENSFNLIKSDGSYNTTDNDIDHDHNSNNDDDDDNDTTHMKKKMMKMMNMTTVNETSIYISKKQKLIGGNVEDVISNKGNKNKNNKNKNKIRPLTLTRIFYFNSIGNPIRQQFMDDWLSKLQTKQQEQQQQQQQKQRQQKTFTTTTKTKTTTSIPASSASSTSSIIPYQRIEALSGLDKECEIPGCTRLHRLFTSYKRMVYPTWTYDVAGSVLVLHDDSIEVSNLDRLKQFVSNFDEKWNVLLLDCEWDDGGNPNSWYNVHKAMRAHRDETGEFGQPPKSEAIIFRNQALFKTRELLYNTYKDSGPFGLEFFFAGRKEFKTYCANLNLIQKNTTLDIIDPQRNVVRNSWILGQYGILVDEMKQQGRDRPISNPNTVPQIDRIYYHNLEKNIWRRRGMELWLSQQSIPYKRINATIGEPNVCVEAKNTPNRCKGISGIVKTLTSIIDHEETSGVTLVLEDDVVPLDQTWDRILESIKYVPDDWDIIRFDCWGSGDISAEQWLNSFVFDSRLPKFIPGCVERGCELCGGAYAMLWRGGDDDTDNRLLKLRTMWNQQPINDADCIIAATSSVQSYCVNIGMWDHLSLRGEISDVSLLRD